MTLSRPTIPVLLGCVLVPLLAAALVRAQGSDFQARRNELRKQAEAAQAAEGLAGTANRKALFTKYPTPEIKLAKPLAIAAGGSGALAIPGKFAAGTSILPGSDAISLDDIVVSATSVKATVTARPGVPPQWARVYALAPVSLAETWTPVFIGAPQAYTLKASNGWTVKLAPEARAFTISDNQARATFKAEYFREGEAAPFETATGPLTIDANDTMRGRYNFMLGAGQSGSAMEEYQELSKKMVEMMQAGKVGTKEFDALQKRADAAQERFMKEMQAMAADPGAMQRKQDEFGCQTISLTVEGTAATGSISCGRKVGTLQVTGTVQ